MSEELERRLREMCNCNISTPCGAEEDCRITFEAADALAALRAENEALAAKVKALSPHGSCGCSYDRPDDLCDHHSPQVAALRAENERLKIDYEIEQNLNKSTERTIREIYEIIDANEDDDPVRLLKERMRELSDYDTALATAEARLAEALEALQAFVDETVDYMTINKLGDPEKQHNVRRARKVIGGKDA